MTTTEPMIRKGKAMRLSTSESTTAIDTGSIVLMTADEARAAAADIKAKFGDLRRTIHEFDTREGWRALSYDSFRTWAVAEIDQVGIRQVYRLLAAAETESNLGVTIGHTPESHLRPLVQLEPEQQRAAWELAEEIAGDTPRQAAHVAAAVQAVGDFEPLTSDELSDLSRLAGWSVEPITLPSGKVRMRNDWDGDRLYTEERSPGGWRYELAQLCIEEQRKIEKREADQRQQQLIVRAAAAGLVMAVTGKTITFKDASGAPYGGARDLNDAEGRIKMREVSLEKRQQAVCKVCGHADHQGIYYSNKCQGCYHLSRAGTWGVASPEFVMHIKEARRLAELISDPDERAGRLAEITDIEDSIPLPAVEPEPAVIDRNLLHQHAESTMAGLLQRVTPAELRMLHCLIVGLEDLQPHDDEATAGDLWMFSKERLAELATNDLLWIEGGK